MMTPRLARAVAALLLLAGASAAAAAAPDTSSVLSLIQTTPALSQLERYLNQQPDLKAYLADPTTVCTVIAPDNAAVSYSLKSLGKYVGLFLQNNTMQSELIEYHVIPGKALTAKQLVASTEQDTRSGLPLWFDMRDGKPAVVFRRDYAQPLNKTDIKAGSCLLHTVSTMPLVPAQLSPQFDAWLLEQGAPLPNLPRAAWSQYGPEPPTTAQLQGVPEKQASEAAAAAPAPASPKPAASSAASLHVGGVCALAGLLLAAL